MLTFSTVKSHIFANPKLLLMENFLTDFNEKPVTYIGFLPRLAALIIDGIILIAIALPLSFFSESVTGPYLIIITSLIPLLYNPVMEYRFGATVGKMAMRIKIVNTDHERLSIQNVIFRNLIYFALQLFSFSTELFEFYKPSDNSIGGFASLSDMFTQQISITMIFGAASTVVYIIELIFLLTDEKYRSLHDRIGKTYVVSKTS